LPSVIENNNVKSKYLYGIIQFFKYNYIISTTLYDAQDVEPQNTWTVQHTITTLFNCDIKSAPEMRHMQLSKNALKLILSAVNKHHNVKLQSVIEKQ